MIYKVIAKVIALRLKPILSEVVSEEQFGFLHNRQIHDAVSLSKEEIHTIKKENQCAFSLKLNLSKAYDRVNWTFVRLLLIQIGMTMEMVDWVMGCIQSISFVVLINGSPSSFFRPTRGIRKGCPLSPLLFMLVIEALSHLIGLAKLEEAVKGVNVSKRNFITRLLFVDDVLICLLGSMDE